MTRLRRLVSIVAVVMLLFQMLVLSVAAEAPANEHFQRTWERTDQPVASGQVSRTWMWGPEAFTHQFSEQYVESAGGVRLVQYFDKSRMEITDWEGDTDSIWYVTNGLLVVEMMTGNMQVGDAQWIERNPAEVNVAGDSDDPHGPTYATFALLSADVPSDVGATVTERVDRAGDVSGDAGLASHQVTLANFVEDTGHHVASVFWDFMHAEGLVYENGATESGALFPNPYYATGFPIAEPYWATVRVGGTPRDVLMQCFERRCLTYTPDNPEGWQVEAGNVGQHYYAWRYTRPELGALIPIQSMTEWPGQNDDYINTYVTGDDLYVQILQTPYGILRAVPYEGSPRDVSVKLKVDSTGYAEVSAGCLEVRSNDWGNDEPTARLCIGGWDHDHFTARYSDPSGENDWFMEGHLGEWTDPVQLQIVVIGSAVSFYINDELVGFANAPKSLGNWVGYSAYNMSIGFTPVFTFSDLEVREIQ